MDSMHEADTALDAAHQAAFSVSNDEAVSKYAADLAAANYKGVAHDEPHGD
jgi:hypothetical protein